MLNSLVRLEVSAQRAMAQRCAWFRPFALAVHFCCREVGLGVALALLLVCGAWRWASRTLFLMSFGELVNGAVKFATLAPRPLWTDDVIVATRVASPAAATAAAVAPWEPDYSFPSSHSQVMVGIAICVAWEFGVPHPLAVASLLVAAAAGLSRAVLGQHYLHDVAFAWVLETFIAVPALLVLDSVTSRVSVCLVASAALLFSPLLLECIKTLVPEHPPEQIRAWEEHARRRSGATSGSIQPRMTHKYIQHACSCSALLVAFLLVRRIDGWSDLFASRCSPFVYAVRLAVCVPVLLWAAAQDGFHVLYKNLSFFVAILWGSCLSFVFIDRFIVTC
jgi:membrane-associated phospholipid phosphatase